MKTVIEMAREAGAIHIHKSPKEFAVVGNEAIERFAALVRADEREAFAKIQFESILQAIRIEREACEKACEGVGQHNIVTLCVAVIRARGETK